VNHCAITQYGQVERVSVERNQLGRQFRNPLDECGDQFPFGSVADVRRAECADCTRPVKAALRALDDQHVELADQFAEGGAEGARHSPSINPGRAA
jgi:hypothetical protein